jgi:formate dehydrogenase major subunit
LGGGDAFIMQEDGRAALFVPGALADGPLPTYYEPAESPVANAVYGQRTNPAMRRYPRPENPYNPAESEVFPYVFTTYRLTEHHTAGGMSRTLPYLAELQPEFFCEVSPALAKERGLEHMGWATIVTERTAIEARVMVTERVRPLKIQGRTVHQVGLPFHWGGRGISTGDSANDLLSMVLDPNVYIQESKAATCDILPGRRPRGAALLELVSSYRQRASAAAKSGPDG